MKAFSFVILFSLFLGGICNAQSINKNLWNYYSYENRLLKHTVDVQFSSKRSIRFKMSLIDRKNKRVCTLSGEAFAEPLGSTEVDTDENGNAYVSIAYNFYNNDKSLFVSFRFEGTKNLATSKRLQISASGSKECNYNSEDYILARVK